MKALALRFVLLLFWIVSIYAQEESTPCRDSDEYRYLRFKMVKTQIETRGVSDTKVLNAMRNVPRHCFVPLIFRNQAYADYPLPIGSGQTISQPYIVAFMTEKAALNRDDRVLEIGTGSGYQAAVLAEIADSVFSIEIIPELAASAAGRLKSLGYKNVVVKTGDGYYGWKEKAPFDAILVTAGAEEIPQPLIEQLAENGRMIIPVGASNNLQYLKLITKREGKIREQSLLPVRFVPFTREED